MALYVQLKFVLEIGTTLKIRSTLFPGLSIFEKLVFVLTSRILRVPMENIEIKNSLDSKLQTLSVCSVTILNILEDIAKNEIFKNSEMLNPDLIQTSNE